MNVRLSGLPETQGFVCPFRGLYVDEKKAYFVQGLANGGDLFDWVQTKKEKKDDGAAGEAPPAQPGIRSEAHETEVRRLMRQLLQAVQMMHNVGKMAHCDLSLAVASLLCFPLFCSCSLALSHSLPRVALLQGLVL